MIARPEKVKIDYDVRFITRKWAPAIGGMETYCVCLCEELAKSNRLDVIALPGQKNGDTPGVWKIIAFGIATVWRLLFASRSRIVHLGDVSIWPLGWVAKLRHPDSKIILSAHGSDLSFARRAGFLAKLYGYFIRFGARRLPQSVLIANSNWIASLARQNGFNNVHTIPLATDMKPPLDLKRKPGQHNGKLFFAGRITQSKGLSRFINTVLPLLNAPLKVRVAGTIWDQQEAEILKNAAVEYLGPLDKSALADEYAHALCVIIPSIAPEGFGLVAVEAAVAGGLVLAANHSGLAESCTPDIGFVADIENPHDWEQQLTAFKSWPDKRRSAFIADAQKAAQKRFSWSRVAQDTQKAYTKT